MKINEELLIFKFKLGEAIAQWGHVELHVLKVALTCVDHADKQALAIGFHSIESFRQKLNLCDNLVKHRFGKSKYFPRWKDDVRGRLDRASRKRNCIAHGWHKLYVNNAAGRRWAIIQIHHADGTLIHVEGEKPPSGAICLRDLVGIRDEFHDLTGRVANMHHLFLRGRAPFPESHGPARGLPTIRQIANQTRAALGYRLSP
jgi:hypothetical protein